MLLPRITGLGDAEFVTVRSALLAAATNTSAVAELLVSVGSVVPEVTETVSEICVPLTVPAPTVTTTVNVVVPDAPDGTSGFVQLMLPTVVQFQPAAPAPEGVTETSVVFAGIASLSTAFKASNGPAFVTVCV